MDVSRRDLLAAFLGAPFAAAACRRRKPIALPPGALVGASDAFGHRLRGAPPPTPSEWEPHEVVIVGGGIAGLAAAWQLARRGLRDVILLELEPEAGGTSRSGSSSVSAFPWGAHYLPAPLPDNEELIALLTEMGVMENGVVQEQFLCRDPEERVFYRGRWYEGLYLHAGASDDDLRQLRAFDAEIAKWVAFRDGRGRRAFTIPTARCSDDPEVMALDRLSMKDWLMARALTSERLHWMIDYACRDDYGLRLADTSAWAALFYFAARVAKPGEESQPFITWPEGNGALVRHLARSARVQSGWLVANIAPYADHVDITAVSANALRGIRARHVIFAAPQFVAARVIEPWRNHRPPHLAEFTYGSWMVANLILRDRPQSQGFPLAWDNVLYESPSLGYVVATHQRGIDHGPTVITYYYPLTDSDPRSARERLLSAGRDEWAEIALSDLERAHPEIRSLTTRIDVMRWGHAMIRPRPGFIASPARRFEPLPRIVLAHSDLSGVALFEEAFYWGVRAGGEVREA